MFVVQLLLGFVFFVNAIRVQNVVKVDAVQDRFLGLDFYEILPLLFVQLVHLVFVLVQFLLSRKNNVLLASARQLVAHKVRILKVLLHLIEILIEYESRLRDRAYLAFEVAFLQVILQGLRREVVIPAE